MKVHVRSSVRLNVIQAEAYYCLIATDQGSQYFFYGEGVFEESDCFEGLVHGFDPQFDDSDLLLFLKSKNLIERGVSKHIEPQDRYSRQLSYYLNRFPSVAPHHLHSIIRSSSCAVIGIGGVGSHICDQLARIGIKELVLVDRDRVELSNLNRQVLFDEACEGTGKAEAAARRLGEIRSDLSCSTYDSVDAFISEHNIRDLQMIFVSADQQQFSIQRQLSSSAYPAGVSYLFAGYNGKTAKIGPISSRGALGCGVCAAHLSSIQEVSYEVARQYTIPASSYAINAFTSTIAVEAWMETLVLDPSAPYEIIFDTSKLACVRREVQRVKGCPICG